MHRAHAACGAHTSIDAHTTIGTHSPHGAHWSHGAHAATRADLTLFLRLGDVYVALLRYLMRRERQDRRGIVRGGHGHKSVRPSLLGGPLDWNVDVLDWAEVREVRPQHVLVYGGIHMGHVKAPADRCTERWHQPHRLYRGRVHPLLHAHCTKAHAPHLGLHHPTSHLSLHRGGATATAARCSSFRHCLLQIDLD